ncbi:restriction endonuclease subunit S [Carnobacterium inhibens]|uniref:restriction endonuclease subunit S n=1 Tax=Carnobacterium inhibens TaxID=147709 RepID=UPI0009E06326|nr:restriction endonuclease subunit S [Carnobacterium inhibens]
MYNEWKMVTIGSLGKIVTGMTPGTKNKENYGNDFLFLTPSDDMEQRFVGETKRKLSSVGVKIVQNKVLPKNSISISCIGSQLGKVVITKKETVTNQQINSIIPYDNVDYMFLYYSMLIAGKKLNYLSKTSTAVPIINKTEFSEFEILLPPLSEQKLIANILSSFDNKIENNNAIIANLEEQAKLIFEKEFMKNDLIKENKFEFQKFGELFKFVKGKKPKNISDLPQEDYIPYLVKKYIDSNEVTFASSNDGILIDDLDVFMLMDGANSGNIYYGYNGILGSTFSWLKNDNDMVNEYIYWYLLINQDFVRNQNTGSAIPHANKDYINNLEVMLPINIETDKTLKALKNMRLYSINLRRESNKLVETRDTLIPKLMSEELRIEEAIATK